MDTVTLIALGAFLGLLLMWVWQRYLGFFGQSPDDYAGLGPEFDIRQHLSGPLQCEGVIYGPTGRVSSRFIADMHAKWEGDIGTMTEDFLYDSGATQSRCWTLTVSPDGRIKAEAPDVIGQGVGQQKGSGVRLNYRLKLPADSGGYALDTVDWMYLMENGAIINRSQFRKYGIKVAELVATMRKKP